MSIEVVELSYKVPGGRVLFQDVSFRVRRGEHVALVGANGVGKTTLLRILAGREKASGGTFRVDGRAALMDQFIGSVQDATTVRDFLLRLSTPNVQEAAARLKRAEEKVHVPHDERDAVRYAAALTAWGEAGGFDAEVLWSMATTAALGEPFESAGSRLVRELSGGQQKRLALEALFRSDQDVLLLDEPDNYLDLSGKRWLEETMNTSDKTLFYVSHDRQLLANTSRRVVTLEGRGAWTHHGSFATYHQARQDRLRQLDEQHRRYEEEHQRLIAIMKEFKRRAASSDKFASRAKASETRLERFEAQNPPPERPREQSISMDLKGSRSGKKVVVVERLEVPRVFSAFDAEVWFSERVGIIGANGTGKSHFLKLLAGEPIAHTGTFRLGARVVPGYFSQTHERPDLHAKKVTDVLRGHGLDTGGVMRRLKRYELQQTAEQRFETLSGGQQARLQILLLELAGANLLLLDEPTDNLDLESAEALEDALAEFEGTVMAVTHDRWLMQSFDRFLIFNADGSVRESFEPELS